MNLGIYDISIDFSKLFIHNNTSIYFKEGDLNTSKVRAKLTMQRKVIDITGCNIVVKIETITGEKINDIATIVDATNGIVEINFKSNSLVKGTNFFELKIVKGESVKESPKLAYRVLDSIEDAGSIEATNEYPILIQLINDTTKALQDAKEALNKANEMQADINEAIDNTNIAISNAETATSNANSKIEEIETAKSEIIKSVDSSIATMKSDVEIAKTEMASKADEKIADIDRALASGTNDLEVKEARKDANGVVHDTLKQRLEADLAKGKIHYETVEGSYISANNTLDSYLQNIEIKGNTIQNESDLADIKSVGDRVEGQELYRIPIKCTGKNLYGGTVVKNSVWTVDFKPQTSEGYDRSEVFTLLNSKEVSISYNGVSIEGNIMWFDANKKFISQVFTKPFIPPSNAKYCSFYWSNTRFPYVGNKLQIEFGNKITSFSEYQEHKLNIISPCQLEKGDIIKEVDGMWGVEKNVVTINPQDSIDWITESGGESDTCVRFRIRNNKYVTAMDSWIVSTHFDKVKNNNGYNIEGVGTSSYNDYGLMVWIKKDRLSTLNSDGFNKWRKENNFIVKTVVTKSMQFIPLPHDQQVKLRTFANQTNISFLTEVEGTIKADVSKSLGATVDSNTQAIQDLNKDLERVKKLEEATTTTVTTESNFAVIEETANGYIEDIKLDGKTLVVNSKNEEVVPGTEGATLKSVGDGVDEIVVTSMNKITKRVGKFINTVNFTILDDPTSVSFYIENIVAGQEYKFEFGNNDRFVLATYNSLESGSRPIENTNVKVNYFIPKENAKYMVVYLSSTQSNSVYCKMYSKSDKKKALYYDTETQAWKKPILREWDSIEKYSDGKHYYHKRGKERILESSLGWRLEGSSNSDDLISFMVGYYDDMLIGTNIICDKFNNSDIVDTELIRFINSNMQVVISKSKLETPNVEGFKKWLQANNVSVVYQLAKEEVYECAPIDLVTFEGETNYSNNCGVISPKTTLKCVNYIGNVINTLKEKVSYLEDKLYNTNLANFAVALNTLDTKLKLEQLTNAPI